VPDWAKILGDPEAAPPEPSVEGYRVIRLLSEAGQGEVYLAETISSGRRVAIKRWKTCSSRAIREEKALLAFRHANIVRVIDYAQDQELGLPCLVMEYVEAPPLLAAQARLDPVHAAEVIRKVAIALEEVHRVGLVHRDVKPKNILLHETGEPTLVDFGTVKLNPELAEELGLGRGGKPPTATGDKPLGTLPYMAPEQLGLIEDPVERTADVYALGVTLYECLCGSTPFESASGFERKRRDPWSNPVDDADVSDVPYELKDVVSRCLAFAPGDRYLTALALAQDLGSFLRDQGQDPSAEVIWGIAQPEPSAAATPRTEPGVLTRAVLGVLFAICAGGTWIALSGSVEGEQEAAKQADEPTQAPLERAPITTTTRTAPSPSPAPSPEHKPQPTQVAVVHSERSAPPARHTTGPKTLPKASEHDAGTATGPPVLVAVAETPRRVYLTWKGGEGKLSVEREKRGLFVQIAEVLAEFGSFRDDRAQPGVFARYRLVQESGQASNTVSIRTPTPRPAAPEGLVARATSTSMRLRWRHSGGYLSGFLLKRKGAPQTKLAAAGRETTLWKLRPNTGYSYELVAYGPGGRSEKAVISARTLRSPPKQPGRVRCLSARGRVLVTWSASPRASSLAVERALGRSQERLATLGPKASSFVDENVQPGKTYRYRLVALNEGGRAVSPWSQVLANAWFESPNRLYGLELGLLRYRVFVRVRKTKSWRLARVFQRRGATTVPTRAEFKGHVVAVGESPKKARVWDLRDSPQRSRQVSIRPGKLAEALTQPGAAYCSRCGVRGSHTCKESKHDR
jgi:serine/threonine protein kinase